MTPAVRRWCLGIALIATLAATRWVGGQDTPTISGRDGVDKFAAASRPVSLPSVAEQPIDLSVNKLKRQPLEEKIDDLFAVKSWQPPPAPTAAYKPPLPVAPPLPYTYFGKMFDGENHMVF